MNERVDHNGDSISVLLESAGHDADRAFNIADDILDPHLETAKVRALVSIATSLRAIAMLLADVRDRL